MSKEKVCPYSNADDCPYVQEASKNKRKKKTETKIVPSIVKSTGVEECYKCNKIIHEDVKCIKQTIKE